MAIKDWTFFRKPYGVGSTLNIWMFTPRKILHNFQTLIRQPKYFYQRLRVLIFQLTHPSVPWVTQQAVSFLKMNLRPEMKGFEWGSGRSTIWLASRLERLVSVEHDPAWYERTRPKLQSLALGNVDYRLVPRERPDEYASQIAEFPDDYFDLVFIDGEFRSACLQASARKVRPGGFVVLDNADCDWDTSALNEYEYRPTSNGVWRTDIFIRQSTRFSVLSATPGIQSPRPPAQPGVPEATKRCPFCAEKILAEAKKCRYCGEFLELPPRARGG